MNFRALAECWVLGAGARCFSAGAHVRVLTCTVQIPRHASATSAENSATFLTGIFGFAPEIGIPVEALRLQIARCMAGWRDFREIEAWQLARVVKLRAYKLLKRPNVARDFKYCDQLRDSARSAPRNIAEGFHRFRHKEFAQFARIAEGSEGEVLNHFIDALDEGYVSADEFSELEKLTKQAIAAVTGLIHYLETTPDPPRKPKAKRRRQAPGT